MAHNTSSAASADVRDWLESALAADRGIRIGPFAAEGEAIRQRQRIYTFRSNDRKDSKKVYEPYHPMFGKSPYDGLTVDIVDNWLHIKKFTASSVTMENL